MRIPTEFRIQDTHPKAYTVGKLKKLLSLLPDDMRISPPNCNGVSVGVFEYGTDDEYVGIEEMF
jgi:hypothetical protein